MKAKGLAFGLMLATVVAMPCFSMESNAAPQAAAQTISVGSIAELRNQDEAFSLLIEAFRLVQGRIIQNDYETRIQAANALPDAKTRRNVVELAKQERELRAAKLSRQIGNLDLTYDHTRVDDKRALAVANVPVHIDTKRAAKTLMDFVFVAPTAPDKNGQIKVTTVPARDFLTAR